MMGAGKTTVGRELAARLGRRFLDSDEQVQSRTGLTVSEIWRAEGEGAFRRLESEALADALGSPSPVVVAAAGGAVLDPQNRRRLGDGATVVWLRARPSTSAQRVGPGDGRPLLDDDPPATLERLAEVRHPLYEEVADAVVDVDDLEVAEVVECVLRVAGLVAP